MLVPYLTYIYMHIQMISEMEKLILKADPVVTSPPPAQPSDRTSNDRVSLSDRRSRGSHSEGGPHPGSDKKGEESSGRGSHGGGTGVELRQTNSSKQKIVVKNVTERGGRHLTYDYYVVMHRLKRCNMSS